MHGLLLSNLPSNLCVNKIDFSCTNTASAGRLYKILETCVLYNIAITTGYLDNVVDSCNDLTAETDSFIVIECHLSYHLNDNYSI